MLLPTSWDVGETNSTCEGVPELVARPKLAVVSDMWVAGSDSVSIVYTCVTTGLSLPAGSIPKNFRVVLWEIAIGDEYTELDVVGSLPSVV